MTQAGCKIDSHESDLYVRLDNRVPHELLQQAIKVWRGHVFTGSDGYQWLDVPFMYDPWWETRL